MEVGMFERIFCDGIMAVVDELSDERRNDK